MRANLLGGPYYYEAIGPVEARVVLTVNGGEFFWRVEAITGHGNVKLEQSDGTSKTWPLLEVMKAMTAARLFAESLRVKKAA